MSKYLVRYKEGTIERTIPLDAESVGQARHACSHRHPGCVVVSVMLATFPAPAKPARARQPASAEPRATEEQTRAIADGLRAFRAQLAASATAVDAPATCPACGGPARLEKGRHSGRMFVVPTVCHHSRVPQEP